MVSAIISITVVGYLHASALKTMGDFKYVSSMIH